MQGSVPVVRSLVSERSKFVHVITVNMRFTEQEDQPGPRQFDVRDLVSPASKSRYDWTIC